MKKLLLVLRPSMLAAFGINKARFSNDAKEKSKTTGFIVLMALAGVTIFASMLTLFALIASSLKDTPYLVLLPTLSMIGASITTLMFTIFKVNGVLFNYKDIDLLMSLPVNTSTIISSRILNLYSYNFLFAVAIMLPSNIMYGIFSQSPAIFYVVSSLFMFIVPFIPIVLASIIGLLVSLITARLKKKNVFQIIFTFAFFILIFYFSFNTNKILTDITASAGNILGGIYSIYPLSQYYIEGICYGNVSSALLFLIINVLLFLIFIFVIGKNYKKINSYVSMVRTNSNYQLADLKIASPQKALFYKEWKRFSSSSIYVFNTSTGVLLLVLGCILLLIFGKNFITTVINFPNIMDNMAHIAPIGLSIFVALTCTTCASVSIEGKEIWIIKSLPVRTKDILMSKVKVNLVLIIPAIAFGSTVSSVLFADSFISALMMYLLPLAYGIFIALFGLWVDLNNANLVWDNEVKVIKQSKSIFICGIVGSALSIIPAILSVIVGPLVIYITFAVIIVLNIVFYAKVFSKGIAIFDSL